VLKDSKDSILWYIPIMREHPKLTFQKNMYLELCKTRFFYNKINDQLISI